MGRCLLPSTRGLSSLAEFAGAHRAGASSLRPAYACEVGLFENGCVRYYLSATSMSSDIRLGSTAVMLCEGSRGPLKPLAAISSQASPTPARGRSAYTAPENSLD